MWTLQWIQTNCFDSVKSVSEHILWQRGQMALHAISPAFEMIWPEWKWQLNWKKNYMDTIGRSDHALQSSSARILTIGSTESVSLLSSRLQNTLAFLIQIVNFAWWMFCLCRPWRDNHSIDEISYHRYRHRRTSFSRFIIDNTHFECTKWIQCVRFDGSQWFAIDTSIWFCLWQ